MKDKVIFDKSLLEPIKDYDLENFKGFLDELENTSRNLLEIKDRDYGGSWQQDGALSAHMNLKRKFDRIHNLFKSGYSNIGEETLIDTLIDLRNYTTLYTLFLVNKDKKLMETFKTLSNKVSEDNNK